jgi:hypothetical protein
LDKIAGQAFVKGNNAIVTKLLQSGAGDKTYLGSVFVRDVLSHRKKENPTSPQVVGKESDSFLSGQYICAHLLSFITI